MNSQYNPVNGNYGYINYFSSDYYYFHKSLNFFINTGEMSYFNGLRELISKSSTYKLIYDLVYYLNQLMALGQLNRDQQEQKKNTLIILSYFFNNVSNRQLTYLLIETRMLKLEDFLRFKSADVLRLYLTSLKRLLTYQYINKANYVSLVLNIEVYLLFRNEIGINSDLGKVYFKEVSTVINANLIHLSFSQYLHFLVNFNLIVSVDKNERNIILNKLDNMRNLYKANKITREEYIRRLTGADDEGMTPLYKLLFLDELELIEMYLSVVSEDCQFGEIENLVHGGVDRSCNCLQIFVISRNIRLLNTYINFLETHFGEKGTADVLLKQHNILDSEDRELSRKYMDIDTEPVWQFFFLLRRGQLNAAINCIYYQPKFNSDRWMVLFPGWKSLPETPQARLKILNESKEEENNEELVKSRFSYLL